MRLLALPALTGTVLVTFFAACVGDDPAPNAGPGVTDGGPVVTTTCGAANPCPNGAPCVDSVCCDSPCTGTCEACNVAGKEGRCSPVTGKPRRGTCDGDQTGPCAGTCDGTQGAECTYPAVACGKGSCAGGNNAGQLGQPIATNNPLPKFIAPDLTATYLTAGNRVTCAATGGGAKCWGSNGLGILGGGTVNAGGPAPIPVCTKADCSTLLTSVTGVTTYDESACAVAGGAVKCWGTNTGGQLGDGNATASQSYAATTAIASGAVYVSSGGQVNLAIVVDRANRDLRWGNEGQSQCGTGTPDAPRKTPVAPKW